MKLLLRSSLIIICLLCLYNISYSAEACFSEKSTIKLETDLKECEFDSAECAKCYEDKDLADKEIELLKQKVDLYKEAMVLNEKTIKQYQELLKYQQDSYKQIIEANKPSVGNEFFKFLGTIAIGVLIGLAL